MLSADEVAANLRKSRPLSVDGYHACVFGAPPGADTNIRQDADRTAARLADLLDGRPSHAGTELACADGTPVVPGASYWGGDGRRWLVVAVGGGYAWGWDADREPPLTGDGRATKRLRPEWLSARPPESWERFWGDLLRAAMLQRAEGGVAAMLRGFAERAERLAGEVDG